MLMVPCLLLLAGLGQAGKLHWQGQESHAKARFRGLAVSPSGAVWATGADGTVRVKTADAKAFEAVTVPDSEGYDFRDVESLDANQVVLLAIGEGEKSRILKSTDGGQTWSTRYVMKDPKGFLDALAFWDKDHGVALGDPMNGRFSILTTDDGGETWSPIPEPARPQARDGEGAFAASGTCLAVAGTNRAWFCTGGAGPARVFRSTDRGRTWTAHDTPIPAANASSGLFSVAFQDDVHGVVVGGDYRETQKAGPVVAVSADGGVTWKIPSGRLPVGVRSAVAPVPGTFGQAWITVGPAGSDLSLDNGQSWQPIPGDGFHAVGSAGQSTSWAVGEAGRVGRLRFGK